jgi:hypothetical protein
MTTQNYNRQSMIAQAIKLGLDSTVANYLGDSQLRQWVCNKGGVIQSKAAVVANAESHIQKDTIIAQLRVENHALASQPQVNSQQLIGKQNEIKSLRSENAKKDQEIALLKRQVVNLQNDLQVKKVEEAELLDMLLLEKAKVNAQKKIIADLVEANKNALGFIQGM